MHIKSACVFALGVASVCAMPATAAETPDIVDIGASVGDAADAIESNSESQAAAGTEAEDGWEFAVTPYLWASGVSGDLALARGEQVEIDTSFSDIFGALKIAGMGAFEARHDRFVLLGDIIYLSLGADAEGPLGFVDADADMSTFLGTALAGYRIVDEGPLFLDVFGGGRFTSIDVEVDLTRPLQSVEREGSKSSLGPVVGVRFRAPLGGRWGLAIYGDVGGSASRKPRPGNFWARCNMI